mmetsp:Transcript_25663/g.64655  ORF Transcript_25663/g.64655 Transcript_25663/m.64655 type:complete len:212 (-) Transcript_25663:64-699(-)
MPIHQRSWNWNWSSQQPLIGLIPGASVAWAGGHSHWCAHHRGFPPHLLHGARDPAARRVALQTAKQVQHRQPNHQNRVEHVVATVPSVDRVARKPEPAALVQRVALAAAHLLLLAQRLELLLPRSGLPAKHREAPGTMAEKVQAADDPDVTGIVAALPRPHGESTTAALHQTSARIHGLHHRRIPVRHVIGACMLPGRGSLRHLKQMEKVS